MGLPADAVSYLNGPVYHSAQWAFNVLPLLAGVARGHERQVRRGRGAAHHRRPRRHQHPPGAHPVRAPAEAARRRARRLRRLEPAGGVARRRAVPARREAAHDRVVGPEDHRVLRRHRGQRREPVHERAVAGQAGHGRPGAAHQRRAHHRRGRQRARPEPVGHHLRAQQDGHGLRVPRRRGEDGQGPPAAGRVHHRRRRLPRRRRLAVPVRPQDRHDHLGRREHLPRRDRRRARGARGRARRRRVRRAQRGVRRRGEGRGRAARRLHVLTRAARRHPGLLPLEAGRLQGAALDRRGGRRCPRHPTGKLYKRLLRDPYWDGAGRSI